MLSVLLLTVAHLSATCVLTEGVGTDFATIGVTVVDKRLKIPPHVALNSDAHHVVTEIAVTGKGCRTSKGIEVGDPIESVEKLYGKGEKAALHMTKGSSSQWTIGDFVLDYPGVEFVILRSKVNAIVIKRSAH